MTLFAELRRRNVFRIAVAYVVLAWLLLQVTGLLLPVFGAPDWVMRVLVLVLGAGFIAALVFSWAYELTPEGVKRESEVDRTHSITHHTARKLDIAVIVLLVLAIGLFAWDRFGSDPATTAVVADAPAVATPPAKPAATPPADAKSIAVLPFVNMSSDPEQTYFSDGIAEELLNALVKLPGLKVAGRTSSFAFRDKADDLRAIGKALDVNHILEGSVRKQGTRIRITAQLVKAEDGYHLWSETYERDVGDIFALQDEITARIMEALQLTLGHAPEPTPTASAEAYALYLRARQQLALRGLEALGEARWLFGQVVAIEPGYAPAWAGLARSAELHWVYSFDFFQNDPGRETQDEIVRFVTDAAQRALAIDAENAEAWSALGHLATNAEGDWAKARHAHERALALQPNDPEVLNFAGDFLYWVLDTRAVEVESRAATLDPMLAINHYDLSVALFVSGKYEQALASARQAESLGLFDRSPFIRANGLVAPLIAMRRYDEARQEADRVKGMPGMTRSAKLAIDIWLASATGDKAATRELSQALLAKDLADELNPRLTAHAMVWADRPADAVPFLERSLASGDFWFMEPIYVTLPERLTNDPALRAALERPPNGELFAIRRRNLGLPPEAPP
jgi:TolB-like protein/Tfp pilus assembly protein PilF